MNVTQQLTNWQPGQPLPAPFEQQAVRLFSVDRPIAEWGNPIWSTTRNAYRSEVRRAAIETASMVWAMPPAADANDPRWRDAFFSTQLADVTAQLIYGRSLGALVPLVRADIKSYADSYTEDAVARYSPILNAVKQSEVA